MRTSDRVADLPPRAAYMKQKEDLSKIFMYERWGVGGATWRRAMLGRLIFWPAGWGVGSVYSGLR